MRRSMHLAMRVGIGATLLLASGCRSSNDDPASFVTGLRLLAIRAEPPEVAPGEMSTLSALVVDTEGRTIDIAWSICEKLPLPGDALSLDCAAADAGTTLAPIGDGTQVQLTMPPLTPSELGLPDSSGGFYLPIIAHVTAGTDTVIASYRLRLKTGATANQNPMLADVSHVIYVDGGTSAGDAGAPLIDPLDDQNPLVVHANDQIRLRATFTDASEEHYTMTLGGTRMVTEALSISWFATAGQFSDDQTGADLPDTTLKLDEHLPAAGTPIDLWVVGRDERGGTDFQHHLLLFQ